jgi:threonyl-tRNA synthetase
MLQDHDHRKLAQRLDLFHFQEEAPGMVFWHPRGLRLYRLLEDAARAQLNAHGYAEVKTPQLIRRPIWEASGHWEHFQAGMFRVRDEAWDAGIKPVSCPGHIQIVDRRAPSYRELPIRLSEFGIVHRDEPSGTLHGLMRLRQFTQDDGHVFCSEDQAEAEVERFCRAVAPFYARFGFERLSVALSTRPVERAGDDREWDRAEAALEAVLRRIGEPFQVQPGAGAFYGPKLEFSLEDRAGRAWQCATIQYDLVMPRRFDLRYIDSAGQRQPLMMLHRALYGSLERFLGILLEHHGALLPAWLAPVQVVVLPVAAEHEPWAAQVTQRLQAEGLRVRADERAESLGRRVAETHRDGVPFVAVVGARELEAGSVMLRDQAGQRSLGVDAAAEWLRQRCREVPSE